MQGTASKPVLSWRFLLVWLLAGVCMVSPLSAQQRIIALDKLQSGLDFSGAEVQSLQADEFANPGNIALDTGNKLWSKPDGKSNKSCQSCHGHISRMKGISARYPAVDKASGKLFNLEDRISQCRTKNQKASVWPYESDELLALSLAVTFTSRGMPLQAQIDGAAKSHFENGQRIFTTRQGQMNLACTNCHDQHYGQKLYTDPLSQGQPNGYPLYRIDWQRIASLERRLRFCYTGVRAEIPPWGHTDIRDISLYLMWRGQGLLVEAPAVRK
jgi:sulfur-oxidizing protein SoxA